MKMPHRATYFFPRQFPERGLDESSKKLLDQDKDKIVNSIKSPIENDTPTTKSLSSSTPPTPKNDAVFSSGKHFVAGDKLRFRQKQISAFCDWFIDKKRHSGHHTHHFHRRLSTSDDDHDYFHSQPETAVNDTAIDRNFDRQVSLPRLSSDSSYAGSLFSSDIKEETQSSQVSTIPATTARRQKEDEENKDGLVKKCEESYILQLTLAKRLASLASLVSEPVLTPGTENWDAESVSYRLWVQN